MPRVASIRERPRAWAVPRSIGLPGIFAVLGVWLLAAALAQAHPHAWIDLRIALEADADDRVVALHQTWVIDPVYSRYLYEDAMEQFEGESPEEKLGNLGTEILGNLEEYGWYTEVHVDGREIPVQAEGEARLTMQRGQLHFRFTTRLTEPVSLRQHRLQYAIYDPTYFIEVLHDPDAPPRLEISTGACRAEIRKPRPDPAIVARALALDFTQTGDPDLGRHFAERVSFRCD